MPNKFGITSKNNCPSQKNGIFSNRIETIYINFTEVNEDPRRITEGGPYYNAALSFVGKKRLQKYGILIVLIIPQIKKGNSTANYHFAEYGRIGINQ